MARGPGRAPLLGGLLLLALLAAGAPPGRDPPEPRSRAGGIRVHPRGSLWATGHFMGKKSLEPPSSVPLGAAPHRSLRGQQLQLSHDLLRILLLKQALGGGPAAQHLTPRGSWRGRCGRDVAAGEGAVRR
ncbi:neuromedin-B [Talpa occidentalis]|uniref:neuromedin-B n=1 Tax=Talpa occidentalis TaxID=50954 RepID=UPI00188F62EE|nr:neuromedin-B [Talpa occidentalis]